MRTTLLERRLRPNSSMTAPMAPTGPRSRAASCGSPWRGFEACGACSLGERRLELLDQPVLGERADDLVRDLAVLEQKQRWDRHHLVARGGLRVLVRVQLHHAQVLALVVQLLEVGGDDAAGAAPGGPEVHEHRCLGFDDLGLEVRVCHLDDVSGHLGSLRLSAYSLYKI